MMKKTLVILVITTFGLSFNPNQEFFNKKIDLKVGIYSWIPEGAYAIELLEKQFEKKHPHIDIDIDLVDPYYDEEGNYEFTPLDSIHNFDIFEIDLVRLDELIGGEFGGIDKIPTNLLRSSDYYVSGAAKVMSSSKRE